ncbi:hypothetical protein ADK65_01785 [Streptomyces sp. NRRL B-1140]|uniref:AfsR/SARP family transcriptional regulator n=1 Tax=Streptomyces sp. NRRL B-1140 TaxID=1415549 RepID=UPI0006AF82F1|nr:AfsR/SARP family transcriptional regulator [Streptomyces sp. NRRL B-1140]KOX06484.1 hypothetical protein ADK65_01785 [Streptomyces sp. NRRL B-1140]
MTLYFQVLGPLEARRNAESITPQPTKIRALTALLCVKAGSVVSRDFLLDALWAEHPPRTARTALQVYISRLRKHLDVHGGFAHRLVTKPHGYVLELKPEELDLHRFELYVGQAKAAQAMGHEVEALRCWQAACALWRGPALADLRGLPIFDNLARQLDERRLNALEQRIALEVLLGHGNGIIGELYGLVAEYPLWENLHCQLMIALYRNGRVAEALQVYQKIRESLVRELGLEPGEQIRRLHGSVLARDPRLGSRYLDARAA